MDEARKEYMRDMVMRLEKPDAVRVISEEQVEPVVDQAGKCFYVFSSGISENTDVQELRAEERVLVGLIVNECRGNYRSENDFVEPIILFGEPVGSGRGSCLLL